MEKKIDTLKTKAVALMTVAELIEVINLFGCGANKPPLDTEDPEFKGIPQLVTGIKGLANVLGISLSTVNRMLADGTLSGAYYQYGRTLIFNTHTVLKNLRK